MLSPKMMQLISEINQFKDSWQALKHMTIEQQLTVLQYIATIESVGSSMRLEGSKISNHEVEKLLFGMNTQLFCSRDEKQNKSIYLSLPELSAHILQYVEKHGRATIGTIVESINAPRATIKKHLTSLVAQGYLKQHGQGRGTWYTRTEK